jgi:DNA polymerase III epsilon subunit-like protein
MRYVSIDLETTGVNPESDQVLEFAAVLDDLQVQAPLDTLPRFHAYVVHDRIVGNPYALSMHPVILRRIAQAEAPYLYAPPQALGALFYAFLVDQGLDPVKLHLNVAGKNFSSFDLQFLKRVPGFLDRCPMRQRVIDPAVLFWQPGDDRLPDTKKCYQRAGLPEDVAHDALADALGVVRLVRYGLGRK